MILVLWVVLGELSGFALGWSLRSYRLGQTKAIPPNIAPDAQIHPQYEITRNGLRLWHGTDGQSAKRWWEHAKEQPGSRDLRFLVNGAQRDRFTVSA